MSDSSVHYDVVVVGAGIQGLFAAWNIVESTQRRMAIVDQFPFGHKRGSSHGATRITRSAYPDSRLVRLMEHVSREEWPRFERTAGKQLVHSSAACLFGPSGGIFDQYAAAVEEADSNVDLLSSKEACSQFPMISLRGVNVLRDNTAGLIDAELTHEALKGLLLQRNVDFIHGSPIVQIGADIEPIALTLSDKELTADKVVITAGPWIRDLVPTFGESLSVIKQTVGFFQPQPSSAGDLDTFPLWVYLGESKDDLLYGLPSYRGGGLKISFHRTQGPMCDPNEVQSPDSAAIEVLREFVSAKFPGCFGPLLTQESCLYTMTRSELFHIDFHPLNNNIVVGSGYSGHGFKFAPLSGKLIAGLILGDLPNDALLELARSLFKVH
jgi:monomeric sarcosine oxidase